LGKSKIWNRRAAHRKEKKKSQWGLPEPVVRMSKFEDRRKKKKKPRSIIVIEERPKMSLGMRG